MGALASIKQKHDVAEKSCRTQQRCKIVLVATIVLHLMQTILKKVLFAPTLLVCEQPLQATNIHTTEAFGPVCTLMPYQNIEELADLVSRGEGSLVASVVKITMKILNRLFKNCALAWPCACTRCRIGKESTGHGSPLPHLVHGGPGRAGGVKS